MQHVTFFVVGGGSVLGLGLTLGLPGFETGQRTFSLLGSLYKSPLLFIARGLQ